MKNNYKTGALSETNGAIDNVSGGQSPSIALVRGKEIALALISILVFSNMAFAQLTGTKTIPGDYATIAAAVADLNVQGVGPGGVTFNVAAGYTENITAAINITTAGAAGSPIVFQKSGVGDNPLLTRTDGGSNTTSVVGALGDAVIRIDGTDYLTFNSIDVAASQQGIEYGYYTSKTATNACQNLTISNCTVTMTKGTSGYVAAIHIGNGSTSTSSATGVTVSANSGRSENITISGNTLQNVHMGVYCRGYSSASFYDQSITVSGNTIRNFGGGSATTTYGVYFIYTTNPTVSGNTIDNAGGGGTPHASTFYGVFYSTVTGIITGNNNSITVNTSGTSSAYWFYNGNTGTSIDFNNNFFAGTVAATSTSYLINNNNGSAAVTVSGNATTGTLTKTGTSGTIYGYYNNGSPLAGTETISGNNFSNISVTGSSVFTGIQTTTGTGQNSEIYNNVISSITGGTGTITGINVSYHATRNIYGNTISDINGAGSIVGIANTTSSSATVNNVFKNKICNLSSTSAASTAGLVTGILVASASGLTTNIYNNLIGNLTAPAATGTDAIRGIGITSSTSNQNIIVSYNTIYLNASGAGNFGTSGVFHTTSATATTANLTLRNNLIYNNSTPSGTGVTAAYRRSSTSNVNYNASSDNNLFWGGTPSPTQLIFTNGTNLYDQLANYQAYIVTQDQSSATEDVQWLSTSCGNVDFLKVDDTQPSATESGAVNVAGITDDYSGTIRQGNAGYAGTGTAPDIGAYEFEGALPSCGTPASSTAQSSNTNPCNGVNFTLSMDVAYGLGFTFQWEESTVGAAGPYTLIPAGTNETFVTNAAQTTWYRCVVTCVSSTLSTTSTEVMVTIPAALNGTYLIDNTGAGDYLSFGDAITDISCKGMSGPVTFNVTAGQVFVETQDLNLTFPGTAVNTVTFQRTGAGANPLIQKAGTSGTADYILKFTGVDYYTFDGIDFAQTGTSATDWVEYGIWITNASLSDGAKNNTIKNGTVTLSNQNINSKGGFISSAFTPTSFDGTQSSNRFLNMTVQNAWEGYRITGATTTFPDDANEIGTEGGGTSTISNIGDGVTSGSVYGVYATYQTNFKLQNTLLSNVIAGSTSLVYGITMQSSGSNSATISGNTFSNITGNGTVYGIYFSSADTADIFNNEIYGLSSSGSSSSVRGIYLTATGLNANVYNNRIYNINANGITTTTAAGIDVGTGLVYNIVNNMISDIKAPASTQTAAGTRGISVSGGSTGGVVNIIHNTVLLTDVATVAAYTSAALHNSSTTPTLDIRNNVFINNSDITVGTRVAAFWKTSTVDNISGNSNNNIYYGGTPDASHLIYYDGTNSVQTMNAYQSLAAVSPGDGASFTENTVFQPVSNGILRPDLGTPTYIESGGQAIAAVSQDFEGEARSLTTPDMGADEGNFVIQLPPLPDCATYISPADLANDICSYGSQQLKWTAALTGGSPTLGYDVYFGTNPSPGFVANVSTLTYTIPSLLPNTTYYWQIVPKNTTGDATGCAIYSFTTIDAEITSTTGDTRCGAGVVNLSASGTGTFNWYTAATGGSPVFTGAAYSPSIATTTDFWVSTSNGGTNANVGQFSPTSAGGTVSASSLTNHYMLFNVTAPTVTINTVTIYPTAAIGSNYNIIIQNSSLTQIFATGTFTNTVTGGSTPQVVTLNATLPAGTGYRLGVATNAGMNRNTSGAVYPYTVPGVLSITGNTFDQVYYYYFYDWSISSGCESPRTMVTGTVLPTTTYYTDADGDTYGDPGSPVISCSGAPLGAVADNTDCNDGNASVNPGGTETCNGIDDDCDGSTDEGCSLLTFYADTDGDTYGDPANFITQTNPVPPSGYVSDNTDCNDGNTAVNPAATEVCNSIDDDCDTSVDEGFDVDGDGYTSCNGDCDDNNNAVNPGAAETCNGVDDNCNGLTDDGLSLPAPASIAGTASACLPGVSGSTTYSVSPVAGATSYSWTVPSGFVIISGQGTMNITVTWTNIAIQAGISGNLCVTANDACVSSSPTCIAIDYQVAAPVTPPSISGNSKACPGDVVTYSIAPVARATSYTWTVPGTMTIQSGQGSNVISVLVNAGFTGGAVTVTASNVCGTSPVRSKSIVQNLPGTPTAIQGQKEGLCNTSGNVWFVPAVVNATSYNWGATGATITAGNGTNTITGDVATLIGSGSLTVQAVNGCGTSLTRTLTIKGSPARPEPVAGAANVCAVSNEAYSVATVAGASAYTWSVTASGSVATGQGTKNITIDWNIPGASQGITVFTSNACGSSTNRALSPVTVNSCPRLSDQSAAFALTAWPNPAADYVMIQFNTEDASGYRLRLTDVAGRLVYDQTGKAMTGSNQLELNLSETATGLYFLTLDLGTERQMIKLTVE